MKKKILLALLSLSMIIPMFNNVNAATKRFYLRSSSSSATYIDWTYTTAKEDVRRASDVYYHKESERKDGGTFSITYNTTTSKSNTSNTSVSGGVTLAEVITVSASVGIAYTQAYGSGTSITKTKPDSVAAGYYYLGMHFPQYNCTYKKYVADKTGTKQQGSTTKIPDMQKKSGAYLQLDYSSSYPLFTA